MRIQIVDEEDRRKIVENLDRTILVEAGAGSGKTRSLVDRMLALIRSGYSSIDKTAAVTFTRKAAAELRGRFQTSLEKAVREESAGPATDRLRRALSNLEQCYIGTIHSFCAKMLQERPVEANLDPEFKELNDIDNQVFQDTCWHEYLIKVRMDNHPVLRKLDKAGLLPEDLKSVFDILANYPEVIPVGGISSQPDFDKIREEFNCFIDRMEKILPPQKPENGYDDLQKTIIRCLIRRRGLGHRNSIVLMESLELLDKNPKVTKNRWPENKDAESALRDWESFRKKTAEPALRQWREYRHTFVLDFLRPALDYTSKRRYEKSQVNYQDSLLMAARMLKRFPGIRTFFQQKYTHILVDEFQDTDPVQAEILCYLAGQENDGKEWWELTPRPGSLFLVGDPKQSIYRFRRADIDIYNLVKSRIETAGGDILKLTTNFRSLNDLGAWNNKVFQKIFPAQENKVQAEYAPLNTVRVNDAAGFAGVHKITLPKVKWDKKEDIAQQDAKKIANWIDWACKGNIRLSRTPEEEKRGMEQQAGPGDFMVLLRYRENMSLYARALEERNIPFEISGGGAFQDTPELKELVTLVRALLDPNETVSTAAALRSIFFGCSDRDLLHFKHKGGDFREWDVVSSPKNSPVSRALAVMLRWREWFLQDNPSTALEKICEASGLTAYLAASELGSSRAGNVYKMIDILRVREKDGGLPFGEAVELLEELVTLRDVEEMSLMPGRKDAVRIMNLHKAKGLEAPVVFLAHPLGKKPFPPDRHIVRTGRKKPKGYFLAEKKYNYNSRILSQPADWDTQAEQEKIYAQAEEERLLYVASTRAKNALIVSTYVEDKGKKMSWKDLNRYLEEVPELDCPRFAGKKEKNQLKIPGEELQAWEFRKEREWTDLRTPSYHVETVTSLAKMEGEGEAPPRESGDAGMSWGRVVHYVLEVLGSKDISDRRLLYETALEMEDREPDEIEILSRLVDDIEQSELWSRAGRAEKRYFEMPFSVSASGEELGRNIDGPVLLSGVIDLIFKEKDGWVIADYKTDEIYGSLERYVKYYAPQIQLYRRFWEKAAGEKVKESGLYFTSIHRWVIILDNS